MERFTYDSPEGQEIIKQIDEISAIGTARREACRDDFLRNIKPAAFDWLTEEERDRLHALQLQIRQTSEEEARARVLAKREARRRQAEEQETKVTQMFPTEPTDSFYSQFDDPLRAYWNLPALVEFYRTNPDRPRPDDSDGDHVPYAWDKAHENDQPAAFPLVWTPDGLQYDFTASESTPVQPSLF